MDSLSSADLDTSSKTPLFIGVAAIIIGVVGAILGWVGFSKASALEAELVELRETAASFGDLQTKVDQAASLSNQAANSADSLNSNLNRMSEAIAKDMSTVKKDLRSVAIQAGTALKKLEAIEEGGLAPRRTTSSTASPSSTAKSTTTSPEAKTSTAPAGTEIYTIKKGDMLYRVAAKYNVSLDEITAANPGIDINRLQIGQEIIIPKK